MSYSIFIFKQASVPEDSIPYVIVAQGAINVLATIVAVSIWGLRRGGARIGWRGGGTRIMLKMV